MSKYSKREHEKATGTGRAGGRDKRKGLTSFIIKMLALFFFWYGTRIELVQPGAERF
jgi:hypothetical protein